MCTVNCLWRIGGVKAVKDEDKRGQWVRKRLRKMELVVGFFERSILRLWAQKLKYLFSLVAHGVCALQWRAQLAFYASGAATRTTLLQEVADHKLGGTTC